MGRRTSRCAVLVLAAGFAPLCLAQTPAAADPPETIAAADQLAATATTPDASASTTTLPLPPPAWTPGAAALVPTSEAGGRLAKWMGVDTENARWLRLGNWEGNLGFSYSGTQTEYSNGFQKTTSGLTTEYMSIRNQNFSIFDPRLMVGSLGVTFGLEQQQTTTGEQSQSQHGDLKGYAFNATLLGEKPIYARMWATRVEGYTTLPFVGTQNSVESSFGGAINLLQTSFLRDLEILPYFDARLEAYQLHVLQEFNYGSTSSSFDQTQNVVSLNAHNGTDTSDLSGSLQYVDFLYPTFPQGAYHSIGGNMYYSGDYGADLGSTWTSAIAYNDRTGELPLETFDIAETLTVHHNTDVQSNYQYNLFQQSGNGFNTVNQNATAGLFANVWRHLQVTANASAVYNSYSLGTVEGASGSLGLDYTRNLPGNGQVGVNLQGTYNWFSDNLTTGDVSIVEESYSAPPTLGVGSGIPLNNTFVVGSSIVVVDTRGGARLPTAVNVDYTVVADGDKTRILVLPTSHVIQPNDPLAISYTYALPAQATYRSSTESVTLSLDYGWFGLTYNHTQTQSPPLTQAGVQFVGDSTSDSLLGALRWNTDVLNLGFTANGIRFDAATLAYDTQSYTAGVSWAPSWLFGLNGSGGWSRTNYSLPIPRTSGVSTARIDLNFYPMDGWINDTATMTVFAYRNRTVDSLLPTQTLTAAGANFNYTLGKLTFLASGQYGQFQNGASTVKSTQFNLSLNRRF